MRKSIDTGRATAAAVSVFAAAVIWLGVVHLVFGEELQRMLPGWPDLPGRPFWARGMGVALALLAGFVIARRHARTAAAVLGIVMLLPVLALHVPRALPTGTFGDAWLNVLKWLALSAGAFVVATHLPAERRVALRERATSLMAEAAPWLLAAFLLGSAVLHVRHAEFVALLMQSWMPWRLFWTYFAAALLAAFGIGLLVPRTRPLAALLTAAMIFSWFFLVHTPRMLVDPSGPIGWSEMAESLAFSAMALLLFVRVR